MGERRRHEEHTHTHTHTHAHAHAHAQNKTKKGSIALFHFLKSFSPYYLDYTSRPELPQKLFNSSQANLFAQGAPSRRNVRRASLPSFTAQQRFSFSCTAKPTLLHLRRPAIEVHRAIEALPLSDRGTFSCRLHSSELAVCPCLLSTLSGIYRNHRSHRTPPGPTYKARSSTARVSVPNPNPNPNPNPITPQQEESQCR